MITTVQDTQAILGSPFRSQGSTVVSNNQIIAQDRSATSREMNVGQTPLTPVRTRESRNPFTPGSRIITDAHLSVGAPGRTANMKAIAAISGLPRALFSGPIASGASQSIPQSPSGMQYSQLQIGPHLQHTNIERQASTSEGPPLPSQGKTASTTPNDVEMPGRTPGRTSTKSANNSILTADPSLPTSGLYYPQAANQTSSLTPETISALQATADAIINKASEQIIKQVKDLLKSPGEDRVPKTQEEKLIDVSPMFQYLYLSDLPPPPELSEDEIRMHAQGLSVGPTVNNFRLLWSGANEHGWNHTASYIFADEFIRRCNEGHYAVLTFPDWALKRQAVASRFRNKIPNLKTERKNIIAMTSTSNDVRLAAQIKLDKMKKAKRHRARRDELLTLRIRIIKAHPELPVEWISILEELSVDDMSSDESDTATSNTHPSFYRIHKVCRNLSLDKLVHIVDGFYDLPNVLGQLPRRGGNSRRIRKGNHPTLVNDKPISDYPETFYNMKYLAKFPGTLALCRASDAWSKDLPVPTVFGGKAGEIAATFQPHKYLGWEQYA
ncbi:hypothetical protein M422DRAFT_265358 [Sphaerobolus stellatus SS14]|uniref:Uncharacterized protein n=1 Tax=Sphaerobolus stellatus (strain SS14) TaxID=990650 RepID=A0A0C9UDD7_SPHS4|nr:hypothetical protein M422DRAFT_265358 [Sphaerobolus stellatus SS14]